MEGDRQRGPSFAPQRELDERGSGDREEKFQEAYDSEAAPRLLYGSTTRFGMVKGSIAARKATAAAAAAGKVRRVSTKRSTSATSSTTANPARTPTSPPPTAKGEHQQMRFSNLKVFEEDGSYSSTALKHGDEIFEAAADVEEVEDDEEHEDEEEKERNLLGPMGSYYDLPKVSSAVDLIRTASHDRSSHSLSQARGLRQASMPTVYADVASTGYYRPSDRIARLYTATAAALTSTSAQSVAKATAALAVAAGAPAGKGAGGGGGGGGSRGRNVGAGGSSNSGGGAGGAGGGKVVTAPFAAESREILHSLAALQPASSTGMLASTASVTSNMREGGNQSPSPTGGETSEAFGSQKKIQLTATNSIGKLEGSERARGRTGSASEIGDAHEVGDSVRVSADSARLGGRAGAGAGAVLISSAQDTRTQLRLMRSPPRGMRTLSVATPPPSELEAMNTDYAAKDFLSWNPIGLDGERRGQSSFSDANHGHGNGAGEGGGARGGGRAGGAGYTGHVLADAEKQKISIARYWAAVDERILHGSPNALGAGAKSRLYDLPPVRDGEGGRGEALCRQGQGWSHPCSYFA